VKLPPLYIYWGLHKAADFIEANPKRYAYFAIMVPSCKDACGCALGWFNFVTRTHQSGVPPVFDYEPFGFKFYSEFDELLTEAVGHDRWHHSAKLCVAALRTLAETRYKPPKPAWARALTYQRWQERKGTPGIDAPYLDDYT
jgi:hypothetical protein